VNTLSSPFIAAACCPSVLAVAALSSTSAGFYSPVSSIWVSTLGSRTLPH
jgi:hypothetical protein